MKNRLFLLVALLLLTCLRLPVAGAVPDFEAARLASVAANPPGVSLTLSLPSGRTQFHQGEVIPLTAAFASSLPKAHQLNTGPGDRELPWNSDAFHVDDSTGAVDPLATYYAHELGIAYSGGGPHFQDLGAQPVLVAYTLNEWLRFDVPGHYRVYLTSGKIIDPGGHKQGFTSFQGRATTSNAVELEILPDDPASDAQRLQQALPLFNADGYSSRTQDAREAAVRAIRFLGTPDAARAMVARYSHTNDDNFSSSPAYYQIRLGLFGFPQPAIVIQEMERRIADPDFPILLLFMEDLAQIQYLVAYPQAVPSFVADPVKQKERQDLLRLRRNALAAMTNLDRTQLAAAAPRKQGKARAVSLYTLLQMEYAHQDMAERRTLARALLPVFDDLTPEEQNGLLYDGGEALLRGPDVLPILRRLCARPLMDPNMNASRAYEEVQLHSLALRRLMHLSPTEGRVLLLAEIRSPNPRVDLPLLCSLPDRTLPDLDMILAANLESCLHGGFSGDWKFAPRLVERYATQSILPRVKAAYGDQGGKWACLIQSSLLAYFLRTDHAYGAKQMEKALAARKETGCFRSVLSDVTTLVPGLGPDVERLAISHLDDPDMEVAADAAKVLGTYGSAAAEAPLWTRLRAWHRQWMGRADQIEPSDKNLAPLPGQLEYALTQALATAPRWLANRAKLQALTSLCVTEEVRRNIASFLPEWAGPVRISFEETRGEWSVAQYGDLSSRTALESKLAQFPRGTQFRLSSWAFSSRAQQMKAFRQLKPFLEKRGMRLEAEAVLRH